MTSHSFKPPASAYPQTAITKPHADRTKHTQEKEQLLHDATGGTSKTAQVVCTARKSNNSQQKICIREQMSKPCYVFWQNRTSHIAGLPEHEVLGQSDKWIHFIHTYLSLSILKESLLKQITSYLHRLISYTIIYAHVGITYKPCIYTHIQWFL